MADLTDPYNDIRTAQGLTEQSVRGYGQAVLPQLQRTIGSTLGGLNAMGALRSGGTTAALSNIAQDYGNQIGAYADQATLGAEQTGLGANAARRAWEQQRFNEDQVRRAQQGGVLKTIGSALGAGVGFLVGGPAGAVEGAGVGGSLTGNAGSGAGGGSGYASGYSAGDPTFYGGFQ